MCTESSFGRFIRIFSLIIFWRVNAYPVCTFFRQPNSELERPDHINDSAVGISWNVAYCEWLLYYCISAKVPQFVFSWIRSSPHTCSCIHRLMDIFIFLSLAAWLKWPTSRFIEIAYIDYYISACAHSLTEMPAIVIRPNNDCTISIH